MNSGLQRSLLRLYATAHRSGVLASGPGRFIYERSYALYKWWEAGAVEGLRPLVAAGTTVIDIGANIGALARRFARWTGPRGRVIAIEPEAQNFWHLERALASLGGSVETIQAAMGDANTTARLQLNPLHPGDHRLAPPTLAGGQEVVMMRLDDLLAARSWPKVSLVKIDVQGAEERVVRGAPQTLANVRPAWLVEVDDENLRAMGSSAASLLDRFVAQNYTVRRVYRRGFSEPLEVTTALAGLDPGAYRDLLFTPV